MNGGQKAVTSVALGSGLAVLASALVARWNDPSDGGWFMYSPNSTSLYSASSGGSTLRTAAVWLAAIAVWLGSPGACSGRTSRAELTIRTLVKAGHFGHPA